MEVDVATGEGKQFSIKEESARAKEIQRHAHLIGIAGAFVLIPTGAVVAYVAFVRPGFGYSDPLSYLDSIGLIVIGIVLLAIMGPAYRHDVPEGLEIAGSRLQFRFSNGKLEAYDLKQSQTKITLHDRRGHVTHEYYSTWPTCLMTAGRRMYGLPGPALEEILETARRSGCVIQCTKSQAPRTPFDKYAIRAPR